MYYIEEMVLDIHCVILCFIIFNFYESAFIYIGSVFELIGNQLVRLLHPQFQYKRYCIGSRY